MPYSSDNPPERIKNLPKGAQTVWIAAFNAAWDGTCAERQDREQCANKIAWAAVKSQYEKGEDGKWHKKRAREERMMRFNNRPLLQIWELIRRAFVEAGVIDADTSSAPGASGKTRVIAASQLFGKVHDALRQMNLSARYIGEDGYVYTDWNKYLSPMDVYYDDDGALFLLCTRAGKLLRIPITVDGDAVTLGEPVEIPLTGRVVQSRFTVVRDANEQLRWYAIAASSVLNRVGEIDSRELFDSFIAHAQETGEYPILSFYHLPEQIRFGVADMLARDGNLYIASGTFDDNDMARAAAEGLSADNAAEWGTSIGYYATSDPTMLRVGDVNIPIYTRGVNSEISIVLEREAAAHFTSIGTQAKEVRGMEKATYDRLVTLVGKERADALAAQVDETNRAIVDAGMITRGDVTADVTGQTSNVSASNVSNAANAPAQTNVSASQTREIVLDDETMNALVSAFTLSEAFVNLAQQVAQMQTSVDQARALANDIVPQLNANTETLQTVNASLDQRVRALERTEEEKRREWQTDLPAPQTVIVTHRPRDVRAVTTEPNGQPNAQNIADATLANMRTRSSK